MDMIAIEAQAMEAMREHAEEAFPEECCGALLAGPDGQVVRPMTNIQNRLHAAESSSRCSSSAISPWSQRASSSRS